MVDLLAVCAHPDDLEVCAGGIFIKAKREGLKPASSSSPTGRPAAGRRRHPGA